MLTDGRYFRQPTGSEMNFAHWGEKQEKWLFQLLETPLPTWIVNGSEFFGMRHEKESFSRDHAVNFEKVLNKFAKSPSPVMLASGDIHMTEISKVNLSENKQAYEFNVGPWHSRLPFK